MHFLWRKDYGPRGFASTMSRDRFKTIMKNLRFDDKATRRTNDDRFTHIRLCAFIQFDGRRTAFTIPKEVKTYCFYAQQT